MIDAHVHLERGPYSLEWINEFVINAVKARIDELYLLEHSFRFHEFEDLYTPIFLEKEFGSQQKIWFDKRCVKSIHEYQALCDRVRSRRYPVKIKLGLEICYFPGADEFISRVTGLYDWDFLTGAIHWIDGWGFDQQRDWWHSKSVIDTYQRYYELMLQMAEANLFNVIAHPDSIKCFGHNPNANMTAAYSKLADAIKRNSESVEMSSGLRNNYNHAELGLNTELLKVFKKQSVRVLTASDAHNPDDVGKWIPEMSKLLES